MSNIFARRKNWFGGDMDAKAVNGDVQNLRDMLNNLNSGISQLNQLQIGEVPTLGSNTPLLVLTRTVNGHGGNGPEMEIINPGDGGARIYLESEGQTATHGRAAIFGILGNFGGFGGTWWSGGPPLANSIFIQDDVNLGTYALTPTFVIAMQCQDNYWHTSTNILNLRFVSNTTLQAALIDGTWQLPRTSAFLAYESATISNVTGDGTSYTLLWNTEVYDQRGDLTSGVFTAPVTGRYHFDVGCLVSGLTTSHTDGHLNLVTSNRTYYLGYFNKGSVAIAEWQLGKGVDADMDASDTASVTMTVNGTGKTADILGSSQLFTYWSGHLVA